MYGDDETNDTSSKLDKSTESKYVNPGYKLFISLIQHMVYLLIYLFIFYSIIIFHTKIFNSGIFDSIMNNAKFGGYCCPFLEQTQNKNDITSNNNNTPIIDEYSNVSLINLIKFDYINSNVNNNCQDQTDTSVNITTETNNNTYGYGLVTFKKKYVNYLYYFNILKDFGINLDNFFNLSNYIQLIKYNDNDYAYNDNLFLSYLRNGWLNPLWAFFNLLILVPLVFFTDTVRKTLVYNIYVYSYIYKCLYNYINEGILLIIFGYLFIYNPSIIISILLFFPFIISGITFLIVFVYNLFFQIYHYILYSYKLVNVINVSNSNDCKWSKLLNVLLNFFPNMFRNVFTFFKIWTVFNMMLLIYLSPLPHLFVILLSSYMILFLYFIIPIYFKGNILNLNQENKNIIDSIKNTPIIGGDPPNESDNPSSTDSSLEPSSSTIEPSPSASLTPTDDISQKIIDTYNGPENIIEAPSVMDSDGNPIISENDNKINISNYVNDKEDYSLVNVWKGLLYKLRYIYILIFIIISIDITSSGLIDGGYNYLVIFFIFLITLIIGIYFNVLTCSPFPKIIESSIKGGKINGQTGGENNYFLNKLNAYSFAKINYFKDKINFFSKDNPFYILNKLKSLLIKKSCNVKIDKTSVIEDFMDMFNSTFSKYKNFVDMALAVAEPIKEDDDSVELNTLKETSQEQEPIIAQEQEPIIAQEQEPIIASEPIAQEPISQEPIIASEPITTQENTEPITQEPTK